MSSTVQVSNGLEQLTNAEIKHRIAHRKLFGLDALQEYLFRFCKAVLTADDSTLNHFRLYDLATSVLLYGPPNTGKTSLCYSLFNRIKQEVTNEINFYTLNIGRMLDPALGQSSRNLEQIFQDLRSSCLDGTAVFLLLDELDTFCMSRSRPQEHDAVRRAMTTLMLELDELQPSASQQFLIFGITNVPQLLDTAVVRRFSLKEYINPILSWNDFNLYINHLSEPIDFNCKKEFLHKIYEVYKRRGFTVGDIKSLYKKFFVEILCTDSSTICPQDRLTQIFEKGFSTYEHLNKVSGELSND